MVRKYRLFIIRLMLWLVNRNLSGANLHEVIFDRAIMYNASFIYTSFRGSDMCQASFTNCDVTKCDFKGADFTDAYFYGSNYLSADYTVRIRV